MDNSTHYKNCLAGYGVATDKLSCVKCVENCKSCYTKGKQCDDCIKGYYADTTQDAQPTCI